MKFNLKASADDGAVCELLGCLDFLGRFSSPLIRFEPRQVSFVLILFRLTEAKLLRHV